jgi:hypothetical protein
MGLFHLDGLVDQFKQWIMDKLNITSMKEDLTHIFEKIFSPCAEQLQAIAMATGVGSIGGSIDQVCGTARLSAIY